MMNATAPGKNADFQNISRIAGVLDALAGASGHGLPLAEIAAQCGLNKSAASRLLAGLVEQGAVDLEEEDGIFHLGLGFASLVPRAIGRLDLTRLLGPSMRKIAEATQDSVYLSLRIGLDSLCIACIESSLPIKTLALHVGGYRPLGVGAGALALLAFLPQHEINRIRERGRADRDAYGFDEISLSGLIEAAHRQGFSLLEGQVVPGMSAIGLPIHGRNDYPFAALSVSCVSDRLPASRKQALADLIGTEIALFEAENKDFFDPVCIAALQRHHTFTIKQNH